MGICVTLLYTYARNVVKQVVEQKVALNKILKGINVKSVEVTTILP